MTIPPQARAFEDVAANYERGRPGYPVELSEWMSARGLLGLGRVAIDLGAGTGKLTRLLVDTGARVIAVEPIATMRAELERILPETESLKGTGEHIPTDDGIADVVSAAMAFHWFANDAALAEIARVLRPNGEFVVVTSDYERSTPLQQRIVDMRAAAQRALTTSMGTPGWREVLDSSPRFAFAEEVSFRNEIFLDLEGLFDRLRSNSSIASLPSVEREKIFAELETMVEDPEHVDASQRVRALSYVKTSGST